jgi:nitroimidazol reductase NimA-like FMN-containing flavoprotein (pyridoxamine 5'-phosphate oxidase superfamily)
MRIQKMSQTECLGTLAGARLARLACAHENQPYVVPTYLVYEVPFLYGFATPGKRIEWMRSNPSVCVEFDDVDERDNWTSIVVFGRYEELPDTPQGKQEQLHACKLLQQQPYWWEPGCASQSQCNPTQPVSPIFYRVRIESITGRRATPEAFAAPEVRTARAPSQSERMLRKIWHTFSKSLSR